MSARYTQSKAEAAKHLDILKTMLKQPHNKVRSGRLPLQPARSCADPGTLLALLAWVALCRLQAKWYAPPTRLVHHRVIAPLTRFPLVRSNQQTRAGPPPTSACSCAFVAVGFTVAWESTSPEVSVGVCTETREKWHRTRPPPPPVWRVRSLLSRDERSPSCFSGDRVHN